MTAYTCHVEIRGLEGIADPAGRTIERALPALGFSGVSGVHVGKVISFVLEAADEAAARAEVEQMCAQLLANPVIERSEVQVRLLGAQ
ncbi:MAG TPA: phosphoribosylformylglycinamidine synthase subunit PurS [Acidimicrobiales bacterium]|nr:phosphoribosylformylglycinamidine synthase subunit PurS [Acidimicrobiales bacterium]